MMNPMFRQGDILLIKTAIEPGGKLTPSRRGMVLQEGETTGHAHRVVGLAEDGETRVPATPDMAETYQDEDGRLWLRVHKPVVVAHEEHGPITLEEPGMYEVRRQREYDERAELQQRMVLD